MITYTFWGAPYYKYGIMGPTTLFELLRPLYYVPQQTCHSSVAVEGECRQRDANMPTAYSS